MCVMGFFLNIYHCKEFNKLVEGGIVLSKVLYSVKEVIEKNGGPIPMSLGGIYEAINRGEIACITIGRRKFIPKTELERILSKKK